MNWRLTILLTLALLALPGAWAISLNILEPSQSEYGPGTITVSAQLTNDSGAPIQATVLASILGPTQAQTINLTYQNGEYIGQINALKIGYYTITVWSVINGINYTDTKTIYVNASELKIQVLAPTGHYGPGQIPVKLNVYLGGEIDQNLSVNATIYKDGQAIWSKELKYPYNDLVNLGEGVYTFKAWAYADSTEKTVETQFTVSNDTFHITVVNPKNQTYSGEIPIDIDVWSDGQYVHHANVTACAYSNGEKVKCITVPEAQYHYSSKMTLSPGRYKLVLSAETNGNIVSSNVWITVPGVKEENGTAVVIPGNKPIIVDEIWTNLQRRYYSTGSTGTISIDLRDPNTGSFITNANATACIHWDNKTKCLPMVFSDKPIPSYNAEFSFPDEAWYEIVINITAPGYKRTIHRFPPIKVGKPPIQIPPGSESISSYIFSIVSPSSSETYPANQGVEVRIQLLDNEGMPVTNANVTAKIGNNSFPLDYDINGEYYAITEPLKPGKYDVDIIVRTNKTSFLRTREFSVSNNTLSVSIVSPENNANITNSTVLIQAEVKDQSGDIVPDATVELIAVSPKSGAHKVELTRDLSTGYYQTLYTLDSPGVWKINVTAEKNGMLPGSAASQFNATFPVKQTFTPREVIAALVLLVALVIIGIIVRAII